MPGKGSGQNGKARAPKPKELTDRQKYQAQTSAGVNGKQRIVKNGVVKWVPKKK